MCHLFLTPETAWTLCYNDACDTPRSYWPDVSRAPSTRSQDGCEGGASATHPHITTPPKSLSIHFHKSRHCIFLHPYKEVSSNVMVNATDSGFLRLFILPLSELPGGLLSTSAGLLSCQQDFHFPRWANQRKQTFKAFSWPHPSEEQFSSSADYPQKQSILLVIG